MHIHISTEVLYFTVLYDNKFTFAANIIQLHFKLGAQTLYIPLEAGLEGW